MANRKRGADRLPTIKGYCKDCELNDSKSCFGYQCCYLGFRNLQPPRETTDYDYCSFFEPKKEEGK